MKSLKHKIMIPTLILAIIGIWLLSFVTYIESKKEIVNNVELLAQDKVEKLAIHIEDKLEKWKLSANMLASTNEAKNMNYEGFKKYFSNNKELFNEYDTVFISDKNGNYLSTNGDRGNIKDRDYFKKAINSKNTVISKPIISRSTGNYIVVVASPIKDDRENVIGLVGIDINLSVITDIINYEKIGENGYAYMINSDGIIMAHPNKYFIFTKNILKDKDISNVGKEMVSRKSDVVYYEYEGIKKIVSYKPVKSTGWSIAMTANYDESIQGVFILRNKMLIFEGIIIISIIILLQYLISDLVKPINKLKNYMELATKGDLDVQSDINSEDEIGILSRSFNALIKENKRLLEDTIKYDKLKTEFFSNVSHELKTPINIIFSTTQLLDLYAKNYEESIEIIKLNKYTNIMKQNCYRLLRLVNNLIDITKLDSGFAQLNLQNKNIVEVIENITLSTVEYIKSKGRTIVFDTDIEEKIMAFDPEQMERIMLNLISNAVKFTKPNDKIEVKIYDREDRVLISVKDTGIGIPKEKQELIFKRFRQVDPLLNRRNEGSGIGLSLIKSLVEMHEGNIYVESEYKKGTEFIIELPVKLISQDENIEKSDKFSRQSNVEKINIEFSDIYE